MAGALGTCLGTELEGGQGLCPTCPFTVLETKMVNGTRTGQGAASDRSRALCQHFLPLVPPPHWPLSLRAAFGVGEGLPPLMLELPQWGSCSLVTSVPSPLSAPQAGWASRDVSTAQSGSSHHGPELRVCSHRHDGKGQPPGGPFLLLPSGGSGGGWCPAGPRAAPRVRVHVCVRTWSGWVRT